MPNIFASILLLPCRAWCAASWRAAQSSCASDGEPPPVALLERFISADCDACWSDAGHAARPAPGELALDWIVPGSAGDDAPLSAAASRDAPARLQATAPQRAHKDLPRDQPPSLAPESRRCCSCGWRTACPSTTTSAHRSSSSQRRRGRQWQPVDRVAVAGGNACRPAREGTPVARNLVRNSLQPIWGADKQLSKAEQSQLVRIRGPCSIPPGANAGRLRVVGWVQDAQGRVLTAAESRNRKPAAMTSRQTGRIKHRAQAIAPGFLFPHRPDASGSNTGSSPSAQSVSI